MNLRLLIATGALLAMAACGTSTDEAPGDPPSAVIDPRVQALANRHGADLEWEKPFEDLTILEPFTFELQQALIKPDGRPVVFTGYIDDIASGGAGELEVRFRRSYALGPDLFVVLRVPTEMVAPALSDRPEMFEEFAFVARVERVWRPILELSGELPSSDSAPEVVVGVPRIAFVRGVGLEIVRLDK